MGEPTSFPWLLRQKITIPDRVTDYVHRAELVDRAMPNQRRLTVLRAAAGFGKTTLLAECARRLRQQGVAVAYVSIGGHETPTSLDAYVAFACDAAGLTVEIGDAQERPIAVPPGVAAVTRSIQSRDDPFCIVFDGLERLAQPAVVAILEFLLHRGPPNLHLALAGRQIPDGLDVASTLLEGRAEIIGTEDLRFSRPDVARFFGLGLSRRALAREMDQTAGWPFAVRISRSSVRRGSARHGPMAGIASNWIESRLFAQLAPEDRALVLDLGPFVWIDETLMDEVLGPDDSMRLGALPVLEGLLDRVSTGTDERWQLHALVREHCAAQRLREDPVRFGFIHRRLADALARRAETVAAMRHAVHGGDVHLAGDILLQAGGVRFWLQQGVPQFHEADQLLTAEAVAGSPRLMLVRCTALMLSGKQDQARAIYAECSRSESEGGFHYLVDDCIVRAAMGIYGGDPVGSVRLRNVLADSARFATSPRLNAVTRGFFAYGRSVLHFLKGEFDEALERLAIARQLSLGNPYIAFYGEVLAGQLDFVRGRTLAAESSYRRARQLARKHFILDPVAATACLVVSGEYELECYRASSIEQPRVWWALHNRGVPFSYFATAVNVFVDRRLQAGRAEEAIAATDKLLIRLRADGQVASSRLVAALRTTALIAAGRVEDAQRSWTRENLPENTSACVDLTVQSMREVEAVSEARARLLIAAKRYEEARSLLRALESVAAARSWRKTQMRCLALSILLEHAAGNSATAVHWLTEFLGLYLESPYAWPLLREPAACADTVSEFLRLDAEPRFGAAARSLLDAARAAQDPPGISLSAREREILGQLPGRRIKQVAASTGLSVHGVRYHLRKLFSKFDVSTRTELLRRAQEAGLVRQRS